MSNERLERIKERVNYHGHLDDDIEWLIKQAEKVEYWRKQHRKRCNELEDAHFKIQLIENQLHQAQAKAERYKQALEQIIQLGWSDDFGGGHNYMGEYHAQAIKISEKALEGEG